MKSIVLFSLQLILGASPVLAAGTTAYRHGDPSGEEQYLLELINRARTDPEAEGNFLATVNDPGVRLAINFFNVNLTRLRSDFAGYAPRPPLAFNPKLLASSRRHSKDMARNNYQGHTGTDGSTISSRVRESGYPFVAVSENVYSNLVSSPLLAHAGFNIDWGNDADGVQEGVGHRQTIMGFGAVDYREIGVSIVSRTGADAQNFGKLAVTQDFGIRSASPVFLLGVAYYDVNGNSVCDPGEGIPGIKVTPATGPFHAVTSASGGYAIPFQTAPGSSRVTFSGGGLDSAQTRDFTLHGDNVKVDLRLTGGDPWVVLEPLDDTASETGKGADGTALFRITRIGPKSAALKVNLTGPAAGKRGKASAADYKLSAVWPAAVKMDAGQPGKFTVTLLAGRSSAEIKLAAEADNLAEPVETARFSLAMSAAYQTGTPRSTTILIKP